MRLLSLVKMEFLVAFLLLQLVGFNCVEILELKDYFSGYIEHIYTLEEEEGTSQYGSHLTRVYFDGVIGLRRVDMVTGVPSSKSDATTSIITDPHNQVVYTILQDTKECSVSPLVPSEDQSILRRSDGSLEFASLSRQLYLVNTSDYMYVSNSTIVGGIILDKWRHEGDFETTRISYYNATVELDIARGGVPSTSQNNSRPVPWMITIRGQGSINSGAVNGTVSSVTRFFDVSLVKPNDDVFDVSVCSPPGEYFVLVMYVPKSPGIAVDYSNFKKEVKKSIVTYTGVAPIQVGNIQIISDTGTALFTTVQISNITTARASDVENAVTAKAAYDKINTNTLAGFLPFEVHISTSSMVRPQQVEVKVVDVNSTMPTPSAIIEPSSIMITATPSSSPSVPAQPLSSSSNLCPTPVPPSTRKGFSRSYVAGLAFGMIILGAALTLLTVLLVYLIMYRYKQQFAMRVGYERQVNT